MSPEEMKREQDAMDNIMRWASDQIVEIFPHNQRTLASSTIQVNGTTSTNGDGPMSASTHQDILLNMIPGDKSKRSIRIYPASRPTSQDATSIRSKASLTKMNGSTRSKSPGVFVKLNVDLP